MEDYQRDFVQIFHVNGNHWVCVSREKESVKLYDSLHNKTTKGVINIIARYVRSKEDTINIDVMNVNQQTNMYDCRLCSLAYATTQLYGKKPTNFNYRNIRKHFITCIHEKKIKDFPTTVSSRKNDVIRKINCPLFCICRGIHIIDVSIQAYSNMTSYDNCNAWYHDNCIVLNISKSLTLCEKCL